MKSFRIKPVLGLKTNVAPDDISLFQQVGENVYLTHCVEGRNVDYGRTRMSCAKSQGRSQWSNDYEDLQNNYVETDVGADRITIATTQITGTALDNDEEIHVVRDFASDVFTSFKIRFALNISAISTDQVIYVGQLSEVTAEPTVNDEYIQLKITGGATTYTLEIETCDGGGIPDRSSFSTALSKSTTYYIQLQFDSTIGTTGLVRCDIYSGSDYTGKVSYGTHTPSGSITKLQFMVPLMNDSTGGGGSACNLVLSNLEILLPETFAPSLGIMELYDGSNRVVWEARSVGGEGHIFRYSTNRIPIRISDQAGPAHTGATAFASDATDLYSMIRYGDYFVFADYGETTPYCSDHNDATLSKLASADTEYKGKYLESFQRRILLANINTAQITNGELSVIWSGTNPTPGSSCTFGSGNPPTNHLFVPVDDEITGIKRMGRNACFVYCGDSINRLDYYANYVTPFGFTTMIENQGCTNHHSIVGAGGVHYLFNRNYGFCRYQGGNQLTPISVDIENWVGDIRAAYYGHIVGCHIPFKYEVAWIVPISGTSPDTILYYNYLENKWRRDDVSTRFIASGIITTNLTWTMLINNLGYTTWESLGNLRWSDLISETPSIFLSNTDGKMYYQGTELDSMTDVMDTRIVDSSKSVYNVFNAYRTEPIIGFENNKTTLLEIWFNLTSVGDYNIVVWYRGGDTVGECKGASWTSLDNVSCNSPNNPLTRLEKTNRFHQIKWGTEADNEPFVVNEIEFRYKPERRY